MSRRIRIPFLQVYVNVHVHIRIHNRSLCFNFLLRNQQCIASCNSIHVNIDAGLCNQKFYCLPVRARNDNPISGNVPRGWSFLAVAPWNNIRKLLSRYRLLLFPPNFRRIRTLSVNATPWYFSLIITNWLFRRTHVLYVTRAAHFVPILAPCTNEKLEHDRVSPAVDNEDDGGISAMRSAHLVQMSKVLWIYVAPWNHHKIGLRDHFAASKRIFETSKSLHERNVIPQNAVFQRSVRPLPHSSLYISR